MAAVDATAGAAPSAIDDEPSAEQHARDFAAEMGKELDLILGRRECFSLRPRAEPVLNKLEFAPFPASSYIRWQSTSGLYVSWVRYEDEVRLELRRIALPGACLRPCAPLAPPPTAARAPGARRPAK